MTTVGQLLQDKGHDIHSIGPDASVYQALTLMADKDVGALLVIEEQKLRGIISERDYARKVVLKGRFSKDTPVRDIMSEDVLCICPDQTIEQCMALMTARRVRHLPVLVDDQLVGIVSIGDVVKTLLADREFVIEQLEKYINGC